MGAILENINYKITLFTLTFYIDKITSFQWVNGTKTSYRKSVKIVKICFRMENFTWFQCLSIILAHINMFYSTV